MFGQGAPAAQPTLGVPIEAAGSGAEIAERIRQGKAYLEIVETPWGIEFYICAAGAKR